MPYEYYIQEDKTQSIRRYPPGKEEGERWDRAKQEWSSECAPKSCCLKTNDRLLTEDEANKLL